MRITVLQEDTACRCDVTAEHGLSLYIETENHKMLFDMGQTNLFEENARALGVDLSAVDLAILSHGHYDHGGGLARFLEINDHAPVYVHPFAFEPHYNGPVKYIGLDPMLLQTGRLILTGGDCVIDENLFLHDCADKPRPYPGHGAGLTVARGGQRIPDPFNHEQYLLIREGERRILISGCSHKGIENIVSWFMPDVLVGGFHLAKLDPVADAPQLASIADTLLASPAAFYTGHCTGATSFNALHAIMGERLHALSAGMTFEC